MMEKKLLEFKGISIKQKKNMTANIVVSIFIGVVCFWVASWKKAVSGVATRTFFGNYFAGTYVLDEDTQGILIGLGIVMVVTGILMFLSMRKADKNYLLLYENHIEGLQCVVVQYFAFKERLVQLDYRQIQEIQLTKSMGDNALKLMTANEKYVLYAGDQTKEAYDIIRNKIQDNIH